MKKILSTALIGTALVAGSMSSAFAVEASGLISTVASVAQGESRNVQVVGTYDGKDSLSLRNEAALSWGQGRDQTLKVGPRDAGTAFNMANMRSGSFIFLKPVILTIQSQDGGSSFDASVTGLTVNKSKIKAVGLRILSGKKNQKQLKGQVVKVMLQQNSGPGGRGR